MRALNRRVMMDILFPRSGVVLLLCITFQFERQEKREKAISSERRREGGNAWLV